MKVFKDYLVIPASENESAGTFLVDAGARGLPVSGTVIASPPGYPSGRECLFQYNALFEAPRYNGAAIISVDVMYAVDGRVLNDWVLFESLGEGRGVVIAAPKFIKPGDLISFQQNKSHKIESPLFVDSPICAIPYGAVLMYQKKSVSWGIK